MNYQNILIVKLSAIGDVIHALPVAHALKQGFPHARITWVVEKPSYELVKDHPYIDNVIIFEKSRCRTLSGLMKYLPDLKRQLKEERFDLSLDLQGLFKSGMIGLLSGASQRLVYCNAREFSDWMGEKVCGPNQKGHIVEQYLDVVRFLNIPVTTVDFGIRFSESEIQTAREILIASGWQGNPYAVLIPGANWSNKRWPTKKFAVLAERLLQHGITSIITGGSSDQTMAKEIQEATATPILNLTGKTSIKQLAWVIKNARVTVGGDTGPMHLSAAVNTPTVALIGPTDTNRNGPYGKNNKSLITSRECTGCWQRKCKKQLDCLEAISVNEVYQSVISLYYKDAHKFNND